MALSTSDNISTDIATRESDNSTQPLRLTKREWEVAYLICKGKSRLETANSLFISVRTVDGHTQKIFKKLNIGSDRELYAHFMRNEYINNYIPKDKITSDILTDTQLKLLSEAAQGANNQQLALLNNIAVGTVKIHLHRIYVKLSAESDIDAFIKAQQAGYTLGLLPEPVLAEMTNEFNTRIAVAICRYRDLNVVANKLGIPLHKIEQQFTILTTAAKADDSKTLRLYLFNNNHLLEPIFVNETFSLLSKKQKDISRLYVLGLTPLQIAAQISSYVETVQSSCRRIYQYVKIPADHLEPNNMHYYVGRDLSRIEKDIASLTYKAYSDAEIQTGLRISQSALQNHFVRMYAKLEVDNRTDFCNRLLENGIFHALVTPLESSVSLTPLEANILALKAKNLSKRKILRTIQKPLYGLNYSLLKIKRRFGARTIKDASDMAAALDLLPGKPILSIKKCEILALKAIGLKIKQIAEQMDGLSKYTIYDHLYETRKKLQAHNYSEAIKRAQQQGLIPLTSPIYTNKPLTSEELKILSISAIGWKPTRIASFLNVNYKDINNSLRKISRKLQTPSYIEAITIAQDKGFIPPTSATQKCGSITSIELKILSIRAIGWTAKRISNLLKMDYEGVNNCLRRISKKLGTSSYTEAIVIAQDKGLIPLTSPIQKCELLTSGELKILSISAIGWKPARIANFLKVDCKNIINSLHKISRKLQTSSYTEAIIIAQDKGLIPPTSLITTKKPTRVLTDNKIFYVTLHNRGSQSEKIKLNTNQLEMAILVSKNLSIAEISKQLNINVTTIVSYISILYRKFKIKDSRQELRNLLIINGYINPKKDIEITNSPLPELTPQQLEILTKRSMALTNLQIADQLGLSVDKVKKYSIKTNKLLGAVNSFQAVEKAQRFGLISIPEQASAAQFTP